MGATTPKPVRRKTEKAIRDRAGVPVLLFYDEVNDKTIMARANADGSMYSIIGVIDGDGDTLRLSGEEQNNKTHLYVNQDNIEGALGDLLNELRIMNIHLSNMTDMQINYDDVGED